jgi:hypothetical protein
MRRRAYLVTEDGNGATMPLFDDDGNINHQHSQQVYSQAAGQVTGQFPAGVPILGAGIKWEAIKPATKEMALELVQQVQPALEQGIDPNTPVMLGLYQAAQLAQSILQLHAELEEANQLLDTEQWEENEAAEPRDEFSSLLTQLSDMLPNVPAEFPPHEE